MDTKFPVILTLCLGLGVLIFQLSGAAVVLDNTDKRNFETGEILEGQSERASVENQSAYGGQVQPESDSNIVGVIIGSIPKMLGLLAVPGVLGSELQKLSPSPWWIAYPVGLLFNVIVYIGGFQVATGRIYK